MKTFKKLFALILALMMSLSLFACDSKKDDGDKGEKGENSAASTNSAEGALKAHFKALEKADADAYIDVMPEHQKLFYDYESIEENVEENISERLSYFEDVYGENIKFNININEVKDLKQKALNEIKEYYASEDINYIEIEEGKEIEFDLTIKGASGEDVSTSNATVIKENGEWKVWSIDSAF